MSPTGRERLCSRRAKYFPEEAQQLSSKLARYVSFVTCRSCAPRSGEEASFRKIGASLDHPPLIGALLAFLIVGGGGQFEKLARDSLGIRSAPSDIRASG